MTEYLAFLLLGLGTGAVYGMFACGLVMIHRASGVINFAYGGIAALAAYTYSELTVSGDLVLPVGHLSLGGPLGRPAAFALAVAVTAVFGLVVYLVVFRPLRAAPALSRLAASIGLMLAVQATIVLRFGGAPRALEPILPALPVHVLGVTVPRDRFYLLGVAVLAAMVLALVYRYTRFGLATRATSENEPAMLILGHSPTSIAAINWILASALAAVAGILIGPLTNLNAQNYTLLVIPALAIALLGRLSSFAIAIVGSIVLAVIQSETTKLQVEFDWLPKSGLNEAIPFIVIVVVLVVRGSMIPVRGELASARLPYSPSPNHIARSALGGLVAGVALIAVLPRMYQVSFVNSLIAATLCLSLVVLTGYVGQISLAQMAIAGTAAFTLSRLAADHHIPFPLAPLLAAGVATGLGMLVGLPALRLRGVTLAIVTIAAATAIDELVFQNTAFTGGFQGSNVPPPRLIGIDLGIRGLSPDDFPRARFSILVLAVFILLGVLVATVRRGPTGRRMLAVRANERAAAATGVNVARVKMTAFALSSFICGMAGAMYGYQQGVVTFNSFGLFTGLLILAVAYLGGITSITGAVVAGLVASGGLVFTFLDRQVGLGKYELLVGGLALIFTALMNPDGIAGDIYKGTSSAKSRNPVARTAHPTDSSLLRSAAEGAR